MPAQYIGETQPMITYDTLEQIAENVTQRNLIPYRRGIRRRGHVVARIVAWQYHWDQLNSAWTVEGLYR